MPLLVKPVKLFLSIYDTHAILTFIVTYIYVIFFLSEWCSVILV